MRLLPAAVVAGLLWLGTQTAQAAEPEPTTPNAAPCPGADARGPVDLNSADEEALLGLPGIGPSRARAIVSYRTAHGAFRSLSQLLQIKGIGRSLLRQLRPLVTLSGATG
jgi:competence protein ComEA